MPTKRAAWDLNRSLRLLTETLVAMKREHTETISFDKTPVNTRFAPSPTGLLHLGHAYAALVAWEEAKRRDGNFLIRLEDIDGPRCRLEYELAIFEDLEWLGLQWERPVWRQSERLAIYQESMDLLNKLGVLYPCFCTRQEIAAAVSAPQGPEGPLYPETCKALPLSQRAEWMVQGKPFAWRLDVAAATKLTGPLTWTDLSAGVIHAEPQQLGDVVLARKDIATSYHLAVTVDDAAQEISLVTRGLDLFASTHIHRLLQALLELPVPEWQHHRLICDESGKRLAKRDQARSLRSLREAGWTPEQVKQAIS